MQGAFLQKIKRREIENRICNVRTQTVHGFRPGSENRIPAAFEQRITELKTKNDKNMNCIFAYQPQLVKS